jgi:molecular chaperone DnaJ
MNLYLVLGLRRDATLHDIKRAYRRLARKYHPDINPGDREAADLFRRISLAYETLSDPVRRQRYDVAGEEGGDRGVPSFEFQGFDFSLAVDAPKASTFGELFGDVFQRRGGTAPGAPERGAELRAVVSVSFEEAIRGVRTAVTLTRLERCAPCGGLGRLEGRETRCLQCDGLGHVRGVRGHMVFSRICGACAGRGIIRYRTCAACGGEGVGVHSGPVLVDIPAGVSDGLELVIPDEGHAGRRGGPAGALHLSVSVRPHPLFRREHDDLHLEVPVTIDEAALGARIDIPTLEGMTRLRVPPGTQCGQRFRLRARGLPRSDGGRGDLVATMRVVLPHLVDESSKQLLREFAARNPVDVRAAWRTGTPAGQAAVPSAPAPVPERRDPSPAES